MDSSSWSGPGTCRTSAWQRGARPVSRARRGHRGHLPVPRYGRVQMARGRRLGARTGPIRTLARQADEAIALVERAQRSDGYLNSYVQVVAPGSDYRDLAWGHELYSFGHLIQAAVAWQRALGDDRLLRGRDARRRRGRSRARAGRPLGDRRSPRDRDGARRTVPHDRRATVSRAGGSLRRGARGGLLGVGRFGRAYWQDHARFATRRRSPAMPFGSSISIAARSTSPRSWAISSSSVPSIVAGATWSRPGCI